jgi:hypothetical protein
LIYTNKKKEKVKFLWAGGWKRKEKKRKKSQMNCPRKDDGLVYIIACPSRKNKNKNKEGHHPWSTLYIYMERAALSSSSSNREPVKHFQVLILLSFFGGWLVGWWLVVAVARLSLHFPA